MNVREVKEYIEKISAYGSIPGLDTIRELLNRMGNPQEQLQFIHIAGTNGKGSILAYLSTVLKQAGFRVGRYISPVISDYCEKIQVNGRQISKNALCEGMEIIKQHADEMEADGLTPPTLFETETAMAFWYFSKKKCDIVVLETGMGGLLDATNIISNTTMEVFAHIAYDHMAFLGETLTEIAKQKAGIIKPDSTVVTVPQTTEVMKVLEETCREKRCNLYVADAPEKVKYGILKQSFTYHGQSYSIALAGTWQPDNACTAIEALHHLEIGGKAISEEDIKQGLLDTLWDGRLTVLRKKPLFLMDGAHNEDAALRLRESLEEYFPNKKLVFIMGVLRDKEYDRMLEIMAPLAEYIVTVTPPDNPRALLAMELAEKAREYHGKVTVADSLEEAVEMADLLAGQECVTIAFGSLSYLGRLRKVVCKK